MKRRMGIILLIVLILVCSFSTSVFASNISLYNNNTSLVNSNFDITEDGEAIVSARYIGYVGVTTGATINIKIERRTFLFFWSDVISEEYVITSDRCMEEFRYQLEKTGTYKCTIDYVISGTAGDDDTFSFEKTVEYK